MKRKIAKEFIRKFASGDYQPDEHTDFLLYLQDAPKKEVGDLMDALWSATETIPSENVFGELEFGTRLWNRIRVEEIYRVITGDLKRGKLIRSMRVTGAAAMLIIIILVGGYEFYGKHQSLPADRKGSFAHKNFLSTRNLALPVSLDGADERTVIIRAPVGKDLQIILPGGSIILLDGGDSMMLSVAKGMQQVNVQIRSVSDKERSLFLRM